MLMATVLQGERPTGFETRELRKDFEVNHGQRVSLLLHQHHLYP